MIELRWLVRAGWDGPERILQFRTERMGIQTDWADVPEVTTSQVHKSMSLLPPVNEEFEDTIPSSFVPFEEKEIRPDVDVKEMIGRLANFQRVQDKVRITWGTARGRQFLHGLLIDDRPGRHNSKVQGFPPETYQLITDLLAVHDKLFPKFKPRDTLWDDPAG